MSQLKSKFKGAEMTKPNEPKVMKTSWFLHEKIHVAYVLIEITWKRGESYSAVRDEDTEFYRIFRHSGKFSCPDYRKIESWKEPILLAGGQTLCTYDAAVAALREVESKLGTDPDYTRLHRSRPSFPNNLEQAKRITPQDIVAAALC